MDSQRRWGFPPGVWIAGLLALGLTVGFATGGPIARAAERRPFRIQVVDDRTGRGVPLVELRTVNHLQFLTDSQGIAAIDEPDLNDEEVYFQITSHGYEFPADGFGYRGARLKLVAGGSAVLKIGRKNIAERLYRVTGSGIYRDSVLVGAETPLQHPLLNGQVLGQDSVLTALYHGRVYWFWGDTSRSRYPLGNFHVPGATSRLPSDGGLPPGRGVDLDYFLADDGFVKSTAQLPGDGPTWLDGLTVLRDADGRERLFAGSMKVRNLLEVYRRGIVEWNDEQHEWRPVADVPLESPNYPAGHPVEVSGQEGTWIHFGRPLPLSRVRSDPEAFLAVGGYEAYTCLEEGTTLEQARLDRDAEGRVRYRWKRNTPPVSAIDQAKLIGQNVLGESDGLIQLRDVASGTRVQAHSGSTFWNAHRRRWVMIAVQFGGTSVLGEVWYSEADTPLGPWAYAVKIVTHDKYSFYNPKQHPLFDEEGGRRVYFEGTYASTFSGNSDPTPRYDYNQIMYRLDLEDERLNLPVAVYRPRPGDPLMAPGPRHPSNDGGPAGSDAEYPWRTVAWFAPDRPGPGLIPFPDPSEGETPADDSAAAKSPPRCYLLPAAAPDPAGITSVLYRTRTADGRVDYRLGSPGERPEPSDNADSVPLGRVWRNPWEAR